MRPRRRDRVAPLPERRVPRPVAGAVVLLAILLLGGSGLVDLLWPLPVPKLVGKERAEQHRLRESARFVDGSLARLLEQDLRLTSRVRRTVGPWHGLALFGLLRDAQDRAVVGRGGWVFLNGRLTPEDRPERIHLDWTAAYFAALESRLRGAGYELVVAPVPRKAALYADHVPAGHDPRPDLDQRLPGVLAVRDVATADLFATLEERRRRTGELLYYQTDSHWTDAAQAAAAEAICRAAGRRAPPATRLGTVRRLPPVPQERDTLEFVGLHLPDRAIDILGLPPVPHYRVRWPDGRPQGPELTLIGTSFSAERILPDLLAHACQQPVENAADTGRDPLETLGRWLARSEDRPRGRLVVLEIPSHHVFGNRFLPGAGEPFAALAGSGWLAVDRLAGAETVALPGSRRLLVGRPPGSVLHPGDGLASVRVRGRVQGADRAQGQSRVRLHLRTGGVWLSARWPAGATEVVLPLVAPEGGAGGFRLAASGRGRLELGSIDLVVGVGPAPRQAAREVSLHGRVD